MMEQQTRFSTLYARSPQSTDFLAQIVSLHRSDPLCCFDHPRQTQHSLVLQSYLRWARLAELDPSLYRYERRSCCMELRRGLPHSLFMLASQIFLGQDH